MTTKRLQHFVLTLIVALVSSISVNAHDFEVDGIYYNILSDEDLTCEVTYQGTDYITSRYSGTIVIPTMVSYNNKSFSVTSIGEHAFHGRYSLTSIGIPNSVTSIGEWAFYGCSSLTSISIPISVTSIGIYAFSECSKLPVDNYIRYADTYLIEVTDKTKTSYTIKEGTRFIGNSAFHYCNNLSSIVIPNTVVNIGMSAFEFCSNLSSVTIPNSVTNIEKYAFSCTNLTSINIPSSVEYMAYHALIDNYNLIYINVDKDNKKYSSENGILYNKDKTILYQFPPCNPIEDFVIPNSVTTFEDRAFMACKNLKTLTFPNSISNLGYSDCLVDQCKNLEYIWIPNTVTEIDQNAFLECISLKEIEVVNDNKFYVSVNGVLYNKAMTSIVKFPSSSPFTEYVIPNSVTSIGKRAFEYCSKLSSVTISNSVTTIGQYAFYNCSSLKSVIVPKSVTEIGDYALYGCYNLKEITSLNTIPPTTNGYSFNNVPTAECILKVPASSVDAYKAAEGWNLFTKIEGIEVEPETNCSMYLESQEIKKGGVVKIPVYMTNDVEITSFNCDITLPEGLSIEKDEYGDYAFELAYRSDATFNILSADVDDKVRVVVYSGKNHAFTGNEGAVFYIPVVADDDIENGTVLTMTLSRTTITDLSTLDDIDVDDSSAQFTIKPAFTIGDVNGDERFTAADVSLTTEYVLGRSPEQGVPQAADTNGDGRYTAADISAVVLKVLEGTGE